MANDVDLFKVEYMRDYIAHLKYARERLLETYNGVRQHSQFVANEVWQDTVSHRFMEMLDQKQNDLLRITESLEHYVQVMTSQADIATDLESQALK
jgi:hypothetical protein